MVSLLLKVPLEGWIFSCYQFGVYFQILFQFHLVLFDYVDIGLKLYGFLSLV